MSSNQKSGCPITDGGCDRVTSVLNKVGVCRSMLVTLALLPFAWNGAAFIVNAIVGAWNALVPAVKG
jgi:hypothetical protein